RARRWGPPRPEKGPERRAGRGRGGPHGRDRGGGAPSAGGAHAPHRRYRPGGWRRVPPTPLASRRPLPWRPGGSATPPSPPHGGCSPGGESPPRGGTAGPRAPASAPRRAPPQRGPP